MRSGVWEVQAVSERGWVSIRSTHLTLATRARSTNPEQTYSTSHARRSKTNRFIVFWCQKVGPDQPPACGKDIDVLCAVLADQRPVHSVRVQLVGRTKIEWIGPAVLVIFCETRPPACAIITGIVGSCVRITLSRGSKGGRGDKQHAPPVFICHTSRVWILARGALYYYLQARLLIALTSDTKVSKNFGS